MVVFSGDKTRRPRWVTPTLAVALGSALLTAACASSGSSTEACGPGTESGVQLAINIAVPNTPNLIAGNGWSAVKALISYYKRTNNIPADLAYSVFDDVGYGDGIAKGQAETDAPKLAAEASKQLGIPETPVSSETFNAGAKDLYGTAILHLLPVEACVTIPVFSGSTGQQVA